MVIEKHMRKAQITMDHIDVGVPSQSACYQCLAHLCETGKKSTKMTIKTSAPKS